MEVYTIEGNILEPKAIEASVDESFCVVRRPLLSTVRGDALVWALLSVIFLGLSCFLIGLTSFDDVADLVGDNAMFVAPRTNMSQPDLVLPMNHTQPCNSLDNDDFSPLSGSMSLLPSNISSSGSSESPHVRHLWWSRAMLDLSLLWVVTGFAGATVGLYLWGKYGQLAVPSGNLEVVLPQMSQPSPLHNLGSLFDSHVVRRGTRLFKLSSRSSNTTTPLDAGSPHSKSPLEVPVAFDDIIFVGNHRGAIRALRDEEFEPYIEHLGSDNLPLSPKNQETQRLQADDPFVHDGETSNHLRNIRIDISTPLGRPEFPSFLDVDRTIEAESEDGSLLEGNHTPVVSCAMDRSASHPNTHATLGPNPLSREQSLVSTHFSGTFDTVVWHRLFINLIPVLGGLGLAASQAALKVGFWNPPSQWSLITALSGCDGVIVTFIFGRFFKVWPSSLELLLFSLMFCAASLMALLNWSSVDLDGLLCGITAAACMATSVLWTRVGALLGISGFTGFAIRSLTQGFLGLTGLLVMAVFPQSRKYAFWSLKADNASDWLRIFGFPTAAGIAAAISTATLNVALRPPGANSLSALLPLHSLVVGLLCWAVFKAVPRPSLWIGLLLIWGSCACLPFTRWISFQCQRHVINLQAPLLPFADHPYRQSVETSSPRSSQNELHALTSKHFSPYSFQIPSIYQYCK